MNPLNFTIPPSVSCTLFLVAVFFFRFKLSIFRVPVWHPSLLSLSLSSTLSVRFRVFLFRPAAVSKVSVPHGTAHSPSTSYTRLRPLQSGRLVLTMSCPPQMRFSNLFSLRLKSSPNHLGPSHFPGILLRPHLMQRYLLAAHHSVRCFLVSTFIHKFTFLAASA